MLSFCFIAEDLCKKNNGGCHKNAKCTQSGVQVNCTCQKGYSGDGHTCIAINPCKDGFNGGCHEHAICTKTGPVSLESPHVILERLCCCGSYFYYILHYFSV